MRIRRPAGLLLFAALLATPARGEIVWRGDFETGNLSQWTGGVVNAKDWFVVSDPVRQGMRAARVELHDGDLGSGGMTRAELIYRPAKATQEGSERFIAWSMRPTSKMPLQQGSHWIVYFESETISKPLIVFDADGTNVSFHCFLKTPAGTAAGRLWRAPFTPDRWHDFVLHVRFSPDPAIGFVELYYDGARVVPPTPVQTMHQEAGVTYPNGMHVGILRRNSHPQTIDLLYDGMTWATALADVMAPSGDGGATDAGAVDAAADIARADVAADVAAAPSPDTAASPSPRPDARRPDPTPPDDEEPTPPAKRSGGCAVGGAATPPSLTPLLLFAGALVARRWRSRRR